MVFLVGSSYDRKAFSLNIQEDSSNLYLPVQAAADTFLHKYMTMELSI